MPKSVAIFGPPGTGKSTRLIRIVEDLLANQKYNLMPQQIALVSFTKAAAEEMRDRVGQPIHCSTVHSLCFSRLGLTRSQVIDRGTLIEFGKSIGLDISWGNMQDEASEMTEGDEYVTLYDLARNTLTDPQEIFSQHGKLGTAKTFKYFHESYENYKESYGLTDFVDMLANACHVEPITHRVLIIDEAQDLSPLQWQVIDYWGQSVQLIYQAGDDDQSIFAWGGADPQGMSKFVDRTDSKQVILDQSYRVPRAVHVLAEAIITPVQDRVEKVYQPQEREGTVTRHGGMHTVPNQLDFMNEEVLLIYRNHSLRDDIEDYLMQQCLPFHVDNGKPGPLQNRYANAVLNWQRLSIGQNIAGSAKVALEKLITKRAAGLMKEGQAAKLNWRDAINQHWFKYQMYFEAMETQHDDTILNLFNSTQFHLSTIHGSKGREADNVVLINGMGALTAEGYSQDADNERRVFYVGVTRAKHNLHIVMGENPVEFLL